MKSVRKIVYLAMLLSCFGVFGSQRGIKVGIWGNTSPLWSKILPSYISPQRFKTKLPPVDTYREFSLNIISNSGKIGQFSSNELKTIHQYLKNGGILIVDYGASCIFGSANKPSDFRRAENILGAKYYGYAQIDSEVFPAAQKLFGKNAEDFNIFKEKIRTPVMRHTTKMQIIYGKNDNALLGYNRVGKGLLIYSAYTPSRMLTIPKAKLMIDKLLTLSLSIKDRDKYFPVVNSSAVAFWGNTAGLWKKVTGRKVTLKYIAGKRPPFKLLSKYSTIIISFRGNSGVIFNEQEVEQMKAYLKNGGVILFDFTSITMFRSKKSIYDLTNGATIMGGNRYVYSSIKSKIMPTAKDIFGEAVNKVDIYSEIKSRQPLLGGIQNMKVLFGTESIAKLGVNRYGKGVFIYSSVTASNNNPIYGKALLKLLKIAKSPKLLDKYFPVPPANKLIKQAGRLKHLTISPDSDSKTVELFKEKLGLMSDKKDFSARTGKNVITLHIGLDKYVKSLNLNFKKLNKFAYYIICKDGRNLVLAGKNTQANRYAVIDFLKRYAGYRQYGHSEYTEITPKIEYIAIPDSINLKQKPDINSYVVAWTKNRDFGRNLRMICLSTHSMYKLVPPKKYGKTNPEYFPVVNGKRVDMSKSLAHGTWNPCLKNSQLDNLTAIYADEYFGKNPDMLGLPFGVNDGMGDCQCPYCLSLVKKNINRYAPFYNSSAKVISKKYPDKLLAFIAYGAAIQVPENIRMEPNILVEITGMGQNPFKEMEKWQKVGIKHFGLYTYLYSEAAGYVTPRYYPEIMAKAWRNAYKKHHLTTIWEEYYPRCTIFSAPRQYVLDEVAWNVDINVKKLLKDYFSNMYAESSISVEQFFERLEKIYCRKKDPENPMADWKNSSQLEEYTFADLKFLDSRMTQAIKLAKLPKTKWRMNILNKAYQIFRCNISSFLNSRALHNIAKISSIEQAEKLIKLAKQGYKDIAIQEKFTLTPQEEKIIFVGKNGFSEFKKQSPVAPLPILEKQVDKAFTKITNYLLKTKSKAATRKFWLTCINNPKLKRFNIACLSQIYIMDNKLTNLIKNPSFEPEKIKDTSIETRKKYDWSTVAKNLCGWSSWYFQNSVTKFFWDNTVSHSGKYSVGIGENQVHGCILTGVPIEANCRYRFSFYVMRSDDNGGNLGSFSVRMKNKKGWLDKGSAIGDNYPKECVGKWVKVELTFSAPPFDATALPLLSAPKQSSYSKIWFDDVKMEKIYSPGLIEKSK